MPIDRGQNRSYACALALRKRIVPRRFVAGSLADPHGETERDAAHAWKV